MPSQRSTVPGSAAEVGGHEAAIAEWQSRVRRLNTYKLVELE